MKYMIIINMNKIMDDKNRKEENKDKNSSIFKQLTEIE